ncbi:hypothetical protein D9M71_664880 [compost metagenome]
MATTGVVPGTMGLPLKVSLSSTLAVLPPAAGAMGVPVKLSLAAASVVAVTLSATVAVSHTAPCGAGRHSW